MKQYADNHDNNLEVLRTPEALPTHRLKIIDAALWNLQPYSQVEVSAIPQSQEVIDHQARQETPALVLAAEQIAKNAAVQELSVERLVETAQNYALGEGNPIFEEALRDV